MRSSYFLFCTLIALQIQAARADESVPIGTIYSLSGWGAWGGSSELNGALLAQEDINAAGGIDGRSVRIIAEDNQSDLKKTVAAFQKLESVDRVVALVGPNWSEFVEVAAPLAETAKLPLVSPSGYKDGLFEGKRFSFTLWPPHAIAIRPLADLFAARKYKNIAVALSENAYLEGIYQALQAQLRDTGIGLSPLLRFNQGHNDFRSSIAQLVRSKPDAVLVLLTENGDLSNFFTQYRQLRQHIPLFSANMVAYDEMLKKNPSIAEGVIYFDFMTLGGAEFAQRYRNRFKAAPGFASAKAYDAVYLLKSAIEHCGLERVKIRECLAATSLVGISGQIAFDPHGVTKSRERNTELWQVMSGTFERLRDPAN